MLKCESLHGIFEPAAEAEADEKENDVQAETPADEEDVAAEDTRKQKKRKKKKEK